MADKIIQWHPEFVAAIDLELSAYRQGLIYEREYVEELIGDESMCQALMEIMEPEINQIINEQTQKILDEKKQMQKLLEEQEQKLLEEQKQKQQLLEEREQSILQMVVTLREFGAANSKIKECLINNYKLSEEEAEGYIESVPKHKS